MSNAVEQPDLQCPSCRYDLTGLADGDACPECGLPAVHAAALRHPPYRRWLHRFAIALVLTTFVLLVFGGTVTSKGVGLAVPDWPNSYGYNMFLFPPSMWVGGIFWEHVHRLLGSLVGFMTIIAAVWLWITNSPRRDGRTWLRWLGAATLALVIVQGVMGGLRVTELSMSLAVLHGITGQLFFCMTVLIAAATGRWWLNARKQPKPNDQEASLLKAPRRWAVAALFILVTQLAVGAVMRHTGAGLAIPDFPTSYGQVVPPMTEAGINAKINETIPFDESPFADAAEYVTPAQVGVHYAHRVWAIVVTAALVAWLVCVARRVGTTPGFRGPAAGLVALLLVQVALGASVIWSGRHPEVATAHQATGAVLLATAALLTMRLFALRAPQAEALARPEQDVRETRGTATTAHVQGVGA